MTFDAVMQSKGARLSVAAGIARLFEEGTLFHFEIETEVGEVIFEGIRPLRFEAEAHGFDVSQILEPGEVTRVKMSVEPPV